jgi:serine/threonine protein kinase
MKVLHGGIGGDRVTVSNVPAEHLKRFLEEARITAQLAHPGVVPVHELGTDGNGRVFFTMTLVKGRTRREAKAR